MFMEGGEKGMGEEGVVHGGGRGVVDGGGGLMEGEGVG